MKLLTEQLKQFRAASSGIKQSSILPILSYLKFDKGTITKNNLESFVTMAATFTGSSLIDERSLYSFLDFTTADTIEVTIKGATLTLSDGKTKKIVPTAPVAEFPVNELGEDGIELQPATLYAIKTALSFIDESSPNTYSHCVFVGEGIIGATTGFAAYVEKAEGVPKIIISKDAALMLSKCESVKWSENATYNFYSTGDLLYGFVKNDTKFLPLKPFSTIPEGEAITIDKRPIIKFCDMCVSDCPGRVVVAEFLGGAMSMNDAAYGISNLTPLDTVLDDFQFNPAIMSRLLKSVPGETVSFVKAEHKYYVTGDSGFVAVIMGMEM